MLNEFENGVFIEECKYRFLAKVKVHGIDELCYVSSSSKLGPFIELTGKEVLLKKNKTTGRTRFTLHAVKTENGYILLNLGFVNNLLQSVFTTENSMYFNNEIYNEKVINGLKVDFFINGKHKILVEAKGIITDESFAYFPSMTVKRASFQLEKLNEFLTCNYDVHYYIVLMNHKITDLLPEFNQGEFYYHFINCLNNGMKLFIYKTNDLCSTIVRERSIEERMISYIYKNQQLIAHRGDN